MSTSGSRVSSTRARASEHARRPSGSQKADYRFRSWSSPSEPPARAGARARAAFRLPWEGG
eukprot:559625-Alexandrium_andersonii.AAC.1